jgi:surface antigen
MKQLIVSLVLAFISYHEPSLAASCDDDYCQCAEYVQQNGWPEFVGSGDAKNWWNDAASKEYEKGGYPKVGSVLVWDGWSRKDKVGNEIGNPAGHVAIVASIVSDNEITVNHANWPSDEKIRLGVKVTDNSGGSWTSVKVGSESTAHTTFGFIYPKGSSGLDISKIMSAPIPHGTIYWQTKDSTDLSCEHAVAWLIKDDWVERSYRTDASSCPKACYQSDLDTSKWLNFLVRPAYAACGTEVPGHPLLVEGATDSPGFPKEPGPTTISGPRVDLLPDFDVFSDPEKNNEISANCHNSESCWAKPVDPGQKVYLRLETQVHNADAEGFKRDGDSNTIEGPVWWRIEGKTGWQLISETEEKEFDIDNLKECGNSCENNRETTGWTIPNYPGDVLDLKAAVDGDDEIKEEGEGDRRKIENPDNDCTNNCSRIERFYIRPPAPPPNYDPTGAIESGDCSKITGWTRDQNTTGSLLVRISVSDPDGANEQYWETLVANIPRGDLGGNYGYEWTPPDSFKDGKSRKVMFSAVNVPEGANPVIGSVTLTCAPPLLDFDTSCGAPLPEPDFSTPPSFKDGAIGAVQTSSDSGHQRIWLKGDGGLGDGPAWEKIPGFDPSKVTKICFNSKYTNSGTWGVATSTACADGFVSQSNGLWAADIHGMPPAAKGIWSFMYEGKEYWVDPKKFGVDPDKDNHLVYGNWQPNAVAFTTDGTQTALTATIGDRSFSSFWFPEGSDSRHLTGKALWFDRAAQNFTQTGTFQCDADQGRFVARIPDVASGSRGIIVLELWNSTIGAWQMLGDDWWKLPDGTQWSLGSPDGGGYVLGNPSASGTDTPPDDGGGSTDNGGGGTGTVPATLPTVCGTGADISASGQAGSVHIQNERHQLTFNDSIGQLGFWSPVPDLDPASNNVCFSSDETGWEVSSVACATPVLASGTWSVDLPATTPAADGTWTFAQAGKTQWVNPAAFGLPTVNGHVQYGGWRRSRAWVEQDASGQLALAVTFGYGGFWYPAGSDWHNRTVQAYWWAGQGTYPGIPGAVACDGTTGQFTARFEGVELGRTGNVLLRLDNNPTDFAWNLPSQWTLLPGVAFVEETGGQRMRLNGVTPTSAPQEATPAVPSQDSTVQEDAGTDDEATPQQEFPTVEYDNRTGTRTGTLILTLPSGSEAAVFPRWTNPSKGKPVFLVWKGPGKKVRKIPGTASVSDGGRELRFAIPPGARGSIGIRYRGKILLADTDALATSSGIVKTVHPKSGQTGIALP